MAETAATFPIRGNGIRDVTQDDAGRYQILVVDDGVLNGAPTLFDGALPTP